MKCDPAQLELIVAETSALPEVRSIASKYDTKLISGATSEGVFAALNLGIEVSTGDLVASIHPCCVVESNWLTAILNAAEDAKVGCLAGEILSSPPSTPLQRFREATGSLRQRGPISGWGYKPYARSFNMVYRREVFSQIGLFDSNISICADAEFAWRMQEHTDFRLKFVPDAIVHQTHEKDFSRLWRSYAQMGADEVALSLNQSGYQTPLPSKLEEKLESDIQKIVEDLDVVEASETEHLHPILSMATRTAFFSGYLQKLAGVLSREEAEERLGEALSSAAPHCPVCGRSSTQQGKSAVEDARCSTCGSQPTDRALARALPTLNKRMAEGAVAIIGDPMPARLATDFLHLETRHDADRPGPADLDFVIVRDFGSLVNAHNMAGVLSALTANLRPDGVLVLFVEMSEGLAGQAKTLTAPSLSGAELDAQVSHRLPNATVRTAWMTDTITLARYLAIVVAATPSDAATVALSLSAA